MATVFDQSSDLFNRAAGTLTQLGEGGVMQNINDYINPYYNQVLDASLGRMRDDLTTQLGSVGDQAIAAGAFGGARHGLVESDLMQAYNRNVGELTSNVSANAFNTGANLALQDRNQMAAIAGQQAGLGGNLFGIGQALAQGQASAGQQQQNLLDSILKGGQQQWQQRMQNPYQIIDLLNAVSANDPRRGAGSATQQSTPGLFDYLSLLTQLA